jgi:hypothetical protein
MVLDESDPGVQIIMVLKLSLLLLHA